MIGEDTWINLARREIAKHQAAGRPAVITDCRFPNEVAMARDLGFMMVWVDRPGVPAGEHASESAVSYRDADVIVANDGSREDLAALVLGAIPEER